MLALGLRFDKVEPLSLGTRSNGGRELDVAMACTIDIWRWRDRGARRWESEGGGGIWSRHCRRHIGRAHRPLRSFGVVHHIVQIKMWIWWDMFGVLYVR